MLYIAIYHDIKSHDYVICKNAYHDIKIQNIHILSINVCFCYKVTVGLVKLVKPVNMLSIS